MDSRNHLRKKTASEFPGAARKQDKYSFPVIIFDTLAASVFHLASLTVRVSNILDLIWYFPMLDYVCLSNWSEPLSHIGGRGGTLLISAFDWKGTVAQRLQGPTGDPDAGLYSIFYIDCAHCCQGESLIPFNRATKSVALFYLPAQIGRLSLLLYWQKRHYLLIYIDCQFSMNYEES